MQQVSTEPATSSAASTIALLSKVAAERYGDRPALRYKRDGEWCEMTFDEVAAAVDELALGLIELGVEPGDRVCILAETRPEWTFASFAIAGAGAIAVPIYPTSSSDECDWVVSDSGARVILCENAGQVAKVERLEQLETVIVFDDGDGIPLDDVRARGRGGDRDKLERRRNAVEDDDDCTIIYTSGTTGRPKGTVLTQRNCGCVGPMVHELGFVMPGDETYLYLPLAHVFALIVQFSSFDVGTSLVYYGGDPKQIIAELQDMHPTYFPSVPRIFEKIYTLATAAVEKASPEDRQKFAQAIEVGRRVRELERRGEPVPDELRAAFDEADERLFKNVRALFGGRVRQAVTGAAPISPDILEFFYVCGVLVLEGWGLTETTGVGCVATIDNFKFGTVGRPAPGVELRIADDGEILMRGPNVFREYWHNPQATESAFTDDGWFMTGDLGELDDEGYLRITGRKKDIIITAGGKNLTPANVENDLKQSRWISQAVMYGDRKPYPVVLITLDAEEMLPWAKERGLPEDLAALADDAQVRELIQAEVDRANANYARVEQVKRFCILDHDLSQETGELTPTLKVKRNVVYKQYGDLFESLY